MRQQTNKTENGRANPETINWDPQIYNYAERTGNLKAEAVGVVSGEKHFPVFEGRMVFKPLTKSKPLSTPLFAYAEVFWSWVIDAYFIPAPQYQLALCRGYEAECGKHQTVGKARPAVCGSAAYHRPQECPTSHTCEHSRAYGRRAKRRKASGAAGGEQGAQQYP